MASVRTARSGFGSSSGGSARASARSRAAKPPTDYEETTSEKETLRLSNPNAGRTMNYHLFQLQNLFETRTKLTDVQVVVDPGIELVDGDRLTDVRVFDLEEFGSIYGRMDREDPRIAVLSAIVARQVIHSYTRFEKDPRQARDALRPVGPAPVDPRLFAILNLTNEWSQWNDETSLEENLVVPLREALAHLKSRTFRFSAVDLLEPQEEAVNTGSYYLDAEVGVRPATERYLEERREIETHRQRAEVEHLREQTASRVFFPELPESVTQIGTLPTSGNGKA